MGSWWGVGGELVGSWWGVGGELVGSWWGVGGELVQRTDHQLLANTFYTK